MRVSFAVGPEIGALIAVALATACAAPVAPPVAAIAAHDPEPAPEPEPDVHIVRPGDTLSRIAASHSVEVARLAHANQLRNADRITVGQRLRIPSPAGDAEWAEALVAEAEHLYRSARFELALERAGKAEVLIARGAQDGPRRALGARAAFIAGCALAAYNENERAISAFARARTLEPGFEPPEGWLSPRLAKLYVAAKVD